MDELEDRELNQEQESDSPWYLRETEPPEDADFMEYTHEEMEVMEAIRKEQQQYPEGELQRHLEEEQEPSTVTHYAPEYSGKDDEYLVELSHQGDTHAEEYLLDKYKNLVRSKARSYFLIGADHEDIVQEGMIGLYKAIRDYRPEKSSTFRVFAELCITRQIITAIKAATRQKHIPLNSYVSLNKPLFDDDSDRTLMDVIMEGHVNNPEEMLISQEEYHRIHQKIDSTLSELEQAVLRDYLDGKTYQEIAEHLGRHAKSIDNALQRVKKKLEKFLSSQQHS